MKIFRYKIGVLLVVAAMAVSSCSDFLDINVDPDNILDAPMANQLPSLTVNLGYWAGSDVNRFTSIFAQHFSGQSTGAETQTQQYEKYLLSGNDFNNSFGTLYATIINDAENIIAKAAASNSPHYAGVAKLLKAYVYHVAVDGFGDLPYSEAQKLTANLHPAYDDDEAIYTNLIALIDEAITDLNAVTSTESPGTNSTIYPGAFATTKTNWIKLANTLKLRLFIHYSEKDATFATTQINSLIASGTFFTSNADNFQMAFINAANSRNPIDQMETGRSGYLVANDNLVSIMNDKDDPRRASYFTQFPLGSGEYVGAVGGAANSQDYSKIHTYLRGAVVTGTTYTGAAPIRMLTYAEYNFIRAEAALRFGSAGSAETFFQDGIRASMENAGVSEADIVTYLTDHGALLGTPAEQLEQIIEEKYVANYGVVMEPWSDWRRTGYPASIVPPANAVVNYVPRSWYIPQSEIDFNNNAPAQKEGMNQRVFWDTRP